LAGGEFVVAHEVDGASLDHGLVRVQQQVEDSVDALLKQGRHGTIKLV
jgi:hypothetical protein